MKFALHKYLARSLALCLISLYALTPAFATHHADASTVFICAPSGALSDEARQAAKELAALLGEELPDETKAEANCPLCTLAQADNLPAPVKAAPPLLSVQRVDYTKTAQSPIRKTSFNWAIARGPPHHI